MRISTNHFAKSNRGVDKFVSILFQTLQTCHGVKIVSENEKSDINFSVISGPRKKNSINVVRIDGVYYDKKRLKNNIPIRDTILTYDAVVYQSQWAKTFAETMLVVKAKKNSVIWNGTDMSVFQSTEKYKHSFEKVFVCSAHWRVNKRLSSIIRSFIETKKILKETIGLFIIGNPDCTIPKDPCIVSFGTISDRYLLSSIYKSSDALIHICHLDACSNSVIEGLSAGIPVLCNNIGGTPEIVGRDGIIIDIDKPFDFIAVENMSFVGNVNCNKISNGMKQIIGHKWVINRPDLDIHVTAKKYLDFFKELLS